MFYGRFTNLINRDEVFTERFFIWYIGAPMSKSETMDIGFVPKSTFFSAKPAKLKLDKDSLVIEQKGQTIFQTAIQNVKIGRDKEFTYISSGDFVAKIMFSKMNIAYKLVMAIWIFLTVVFVVGAFSEPDVWFKIIAFILVAAAIWWRHNFKKRELNHPNARKLQAWLEKDRK